MPQRDVHCDSDRGADGEGWGGRTGRVVGGRVGLWVGPLLSLFSSLESPQAPAHLTGGHS